MSGYSDPAPLVCYIDGIDLVVETMTGENLGRGPIIPQPLGPGETVSCHYRDGGVAVMISDVRYRAFLEIAGGFGGLRISDPICEESVRALR